MPCALRRRGVRFVLALAEDISKAYEKYYGVGAETIDELAQDEVDDEEDLELMFSDDKRNRRGRSGGQYHQIRQPSHLAGLPQPRNGHPFEPHEDELQIRHRIDGIPTNIRYRRRSKAAGGTNFPHQGNERHEHCRKRLSQDGRINVRIKGEEIDIRVSTVPTVYGESVSLRLLTRGSVLKGMDSLGMSREIETPIREIIHQPHGIVLVTGPTGSGKSTSLYSFLNTINSTDKRIMTVEDPVEYEMKGVNQVSVENDIGRTCSCASPFPTAGSGCDHGG